MQPQPTRPYRTAARFALGLLAMTMVLELAARAAVLTAGTPTLRWHDYGAQLKIEQLDTKSESFDTIIIGTSMAQQGLVPEALSTRSAYNAGLNGGVPVVMEPWLTNHILDRVSDEDQPTTVIWGLSSLDLSASYGQATIDAYDQSPSGRTGLLAKLDRAIAGQSTFVANRAILRNPSALAGQQRQTSLDQYDDAVLALGSSGERRDFTESTSAERAGEIQQRISSYALDVDDIAAIVRTIEDLQIQGTEVVLVELPVPPRFLALYDTEQAHRAFQQALEAISVQMDVQLVVSPDSFTDDDFVDFTHLTETSARRFTETVDAHLG